MFLFAFWRLRLRLLKGWFRNMTVLKCHALQALGITNAFTCLLSENGLEEESRSSETAEQAD